MKKCFVEKVWLEDEGRKIFPDLYEAVYLASDVDTRIAELEKALRDVREHGCNECLECTMAINRVLMERGAK